MTIRVVQEMIPILDKLSVLFHRVLFNICVGYLLYTGELGTANALPWYKVRRSLVFVYFSLIYVFHSAGICRLVLRRPHLPVKPKRTETSTAAVRYALSSGYAFP